MHNLVGAAGWDPVRPTLLDYRKELKANTGDHSSDVLVLCSPLTRALETAVLASEQLGILTTGSNFQVCAPTPIPSVPS